MRLMLEQWGNITGEPRGVDYTEVLGSWTPASNGWSDVEQGEVCYLSSIGPDGVRHCRCVWFDSGWASLQH